MSQIDPTSNAAPQHATGVYAATGNNAEVGSVGSTPLLPLTAERYRFGAEIARGGMGEIYRATDMVLNREVAVKVLQAKYAPTSSTARRFAHEACISGQLQHPAIPPVHDLGILPDGRPFLVMKLINGDTLDEMLKLRSTPSEDRGRFIAVFEQICQAMAYAHAHNVIHRDLKPANVMVGAFGEVQVMDWGLAKVLESCASDGMGSINSDLTCAETEVKSLQDSEDLLTQAGSVLGTPAYMPPEQAVGAVHEIDTRSDVFGLGGILAAILTGRPPFQGDTAEGTRVMAAKGKVQDCFERLNTCEADPEMVALCKRCLAPERDDRPADAAAVAAAVALLRTAAEERARQAELDIVRVEGEQAAAEAQAAERRKRRRMWLVSAVALVLVLISGLGAVLVVQSRARRDVEAKNEALESERAKVEHRFEMARKAIATFHTTIDEQPELGNEAFRPLRRKLLESAAEFYRDLDGLLADETDPKSRAALADGYFQLAVLTEKIGDQKEALAEYRKALAIRRDLAAAPESDAKARLAVSVTLRRFGVLIAITGDTTVARQALAEARDLAIELEAETPTTEFRQALAASHQSYGWLLARLGQYPEELEEYRKALPIRQWLADAHPAVTEYQSDLASTHRSTGLALRDLGKPEEALSEYRKALAIMQRLADAFPGITEYQSRLSDTYNSIGVLLSRTRQYPEALSAHKDALAVRQRLADANPAVTKYQSDLAQSHDNIGIVLRALGKSAEGLAATNDALAVRERLAHANPAVTTLQSELADSLHNTGIALDTIGQLAESLAAFERSLAIRKRLADANPAVTEYQSDLASSHLSIGRLLTQLGKPVEALASFQNAWEIHKKLDPDHPETHNAEWDVISSLIALQRYDEAVLRMDESLKLADKSITAGKRPNPRLKQQMIIFRLKIFAAQKNVSGYREWLEMYEQLELTTPGGLYDAACYRGALAGWLKDKPKEATLEADQAMNWLRKAVAAGWMDVARIKKEGDLESLSSRSDFKILLADLEAKAPTRTEVTPPPRPAK